MLAGIALAPVFSAFSQPFLNRISTAFTPLLATLSKHTFCALWMYMCKSFILSLLPESMGVTRPRHLEVSFRMRTRTLSRRVSKRLALNLGFVLALLLAVMAGYTLTQTHARPAAPLSANQALTQASQRTGVPVELLKAICYMEGRVSMNAGEASNDNGFGCMHLVKNQQFDTLDQAASELGVPVAQLKQDLGTNILGGAQVLREDALTISSNQQVPTQLSGWYGAVAAYSDLRVRALALLYANHVYQILNHGFTLRTTTGETVTLAPQAVTPDTATASTLHASATGPSAQSCMAGTTDSNVDYPGAIDCLLAPSSLYDCNSATSPSNCNYTSSTRPTSCLVAFPSPVTTQPCKVNQVVIHDTEGSLESALSEFMCLGNTSPNTSCVPSSVQYIIDTDGTVYQVLHEQDIAYHDGNFWSNTHSIGIEHVGYDATGYTWYNAAQYAASARLVAYLLKKYAIPLDHNHIISHGTVYASTSAEWNHLDPGPYWLWDYYFNLISQQGVTNASTYAPPNTITLHPRTDQTLNGPPDANGNATELPGDYNFFFLYTGPSTKSGLIPQLGKNDPIDVSDNIEPDVSYSFVDKATDAGGSGDTMYEIWYGELDQYQSSSSYFADAKLAWLAVPPGDGVEGRGLLPDSPSRVILASNGAGNPQIYSRPTSQSTYVIGQAPAGAVFCTALAVTEDNTTIRWYEINFNHRQAWIPASEVSPLHPL